jgi:hypothetical protein
MSNLIITIISIALVAITVLVGAYYGGTAFNNYQAKTAALAVRNKVEQIVAATKLWEADHGQSFEAGAISNGAISVYNLVPVLVPTYMQSFTDANLNIIPEQGQGMNYYSQWIVSHDNLVNGSYNLDPNNPPFYFTINLNGTYALNDSDKQNWINICFGAAHLARGAAALPLLGVNQANVDQAGTFDCFTDNPPSECESNCAMHIIYKM